MGSEATSSDCVAPCEHFGFEVFEFGTHFAIRSDLNAEGLVSLVGFLAFDTVGSILQEQVTGALCLGCKSPFVVLADDFYKVPVAFLRG